MAAISSISRHSGASRDPYLSRRRPSEVRKDRNLGPGLRRDDGKSNRGHGRSHNSANAIVCVHGGRSQIHHH
jgi:hypothetical protein